MNTRKKSFISQTIRIIIVIIIIIIILLIIVIKLLQRIEAHLMLDKLCDFVFHCRRVRNTQLGQKG